MDSQDVEAAITLTAFSRNQRELSPLQLNIEGERLASDLDVIKRAREQHRDCLGRYISDQMANPRDDRHQWILRDYNGLSILDVTYAQTEVYSQAYVAFYKNLISTRDTANYNYYH